MWLNYFWISYLGRYYETFDVKQNMHWGPIKIEGFNYLHKHSIVEVKKSLRFRSHWDLSDTYVKFNWKMAIANANAIARNSMWTEPYTCTKLPQLDWFYFWYWTHTQTVELIKIICTTLSPTKLYYKYTARFGINLISKTSILYVEEKLHS